MKAKTDELQKAVYDLSSKVYQAAGAAAQQAQDGGADNSGSDQGGNDNGFVDAEFKEE